MKISRKVFEPIIVAALAAMSSAMYTTIVFPNSFAPSGLDGICTMIQDTFDVSMGYLSFLVNIPLLIFAWIFLSKDFSIRTTLYVMVFSITTIALRKADISSFYYYTANGTSTVLAPIAAGSIRAIIYVLCIKLNASSGGVDVISALIKRKKPHLNFMSTIFFINMLIAGMSYFVYGYRLEPVICSIIYAFVTSTVSNHIRSERSETVKFEIITPDAEGLLAEISGTLHQPATIVEAQGAYTGTPKKLVMCVVAKETAPLIEEIIHSSSDTVYFKSTINNSNL